MDNVLVWISVLTSLLSLITIIFTVRKHSKEYMNEIKAEREKPFVDIKQRLDSINNELKMVKSQMGELKVSQRVNEKDRLRENILSFGDKLRTNNKNNGTFVISMHSFETIFKDHEKYKGLDGNSFVDEEFKFILGEVEKYRN